MACECHDSEREHDDWAAKEQAYWLAYFGPAAIKTNHESERFYREEGIDPNDLEALRRLK